jgi:hypothetical protein
MKMVDIDCLKTKSDIQKANEWISGSVTKVGNEYVPTEAIYWCSTKYRTFESASELGLLPIGNFAHSSSISDICLSLIKEIDDVAQRHGRARKGTFRPEVKQVLILTDREYNSLEKLKATPIPPFLIGMKRTLN